MNFGDKFLTAMRAIYNKPKAKIKLNNIRSDFMSINRGTRQGCPISPLLFALCIEPLANMIRSHQDIRGIHMKQKEYKTSLFADNVILYLSDPKRSVESILNIFQEASGLSINKDKSEIYPIFIQPEDLQEIQNLTSYKWVKSTWKYLGITFPLDIKNVYKANFNVIFKEVMISLNSLTKKTFSWIDRLHIVKSFISAKFIFLTRMLPILIPKADLQKWQMLLNKFIWSQKRQLISQDYETSVQ